MSDMEERKKFEEAFKDAFDNASVEPSDNVWLSIELSLAKEESSKMKRTVLVYQLLAAASMAFALFVAGFGLFDKSSQNQLSANHSIQEGSATQETLANSSSVKNAVDEFIASTKEIDQSHELMGAKNSQKPFMQNSSTTYAHRSHQKSNTTLVTNSTGFSQSYERSVQDEVSNGLLADASSNQNLTGSLIDIGKLPAKVSSVSILTVEDSEEVDPVAKMFAALEQREKSFQDEDDKKKDSYDDNLWTSVAFAAGGFNGGEHMSSPRTSLMATQGRLNTTVHKTMDEQINAPGVSYSYGVGVGKKISEKWILQGGVSYLTHNSNYRANSVLTTDYEKFDAISLNTINSSEEKMVLSSSEYNVSNSAQYVSLPMQAGYLLVNKKVSILVNAGVSTDMFLKSIITPDSDGVARTTQKRGDDSPYRSVNFSGLFGTELGYKLGQHYQLAINPGIRYPLNSIYKSELNVSSSPMTIDVGLKFRYIFQ